MNNLPALVYPEYYHRPVAHMGDVELFQQRVAEVLNQYSVDQLRSHAEQVLVFDHSKSYQQHALFQTFEDVERYVKYSNALRNATSAWKRWSLKRSYSSTMYDIQKFECVLSYSWHAHEGSRFPERYEPEYLTLAITAGGMYKAVYSARHGGCYFVKCSGLNEQELVAVWIATH